MRTLTFLSTLAATCNLAVAVHFPVIGSSIQQRSLYKRAEVHGSAPLNNTRDVRYWTNITLGGEIFTVLIDTGSADLWVVNTPPVPGAVNTGARSGVNYVGVSVEGPVLSASFGFAGHTVPNQAFLSIPIASAPFTGLIGLGPSQGSDILGVLGSPRGNTPLDNIFLLDLTTPNYITILLGRASDPDGSFMGDITVGEILPGYEAVTSQPQLPISVVPPILRIGQHWQAQLDQDGVIGPDGKPIAVTSTVSQSTDPRRLVAALDSGCAFPQVPKSVSDAIYGSYQHAVFIYHTDVGSVWALPCTSEVHIAFKFGNNTYHVHPLDAVIKFLAHPYRDALGVEFCFGAFVPFTFDAHGIFDMLLGVGFMRSTYSYFNFGNFIANSTNRAPPYMQLLSTTNSSAEAHREFVLARGGSNTPYPIPSYGPSTQGGAGNWFKKNRKLLFLIVGCALGGLALCTLGFCLCLRSRARKAKSTIGSYARLHDHKAPGAATDIHMTPQQTWQKAQYAPQYNEPWGPRY